VQTVEHLLSALCALGVSDVLVEVTGPEIPLMDGSAARFADALESAGIVFTPDPAVEAIVVRRTSGSA